MLGDIEELAIGLFLEGASVNMLLESIHSAEKRAVPPKFQLVPF